ncbi:hypothetical protein J2X56_001177 [Herbaspirillum sp. 1173]|uniref:DUF2169 domain-containing protein n=1 Tax=Herbaspirillum sp. 1173 TaxID=2817734 RepID=UPI00285AE021|nr:DUF2169 domain-containing protein [Herbaspirillum sp. 1173]MDR6739191.1 hypothetical protein [Herbaspirillum sp. 1173]
MKLFLPDHMTLLHRSLRFARRRTLAIGLLGLFEFGRSGPGALREAADLWRIATAALGEDGILDEGFPKPAAEFLCYGSAHAPGGTPVTEMVVSAQLGSARKQLLVSGDRHFNALGFIAAPQPFSRMPITPAHAFGGPGHAANPAGKGAAAITDADGAVVWPLPNIEAPGACLISQGEVVAPSGFGGGLNGPERRAWMGSFDARARSSARPHPWWPAVAAGRFR